MNLKTVAKRIIRRVRPANVATLSGEHTDYIENVINQISFNQNSRVLAENLEQVTVQDLKSENNIHDAVDILKSEGIFVVPSFFEPSKAQEIQQVLERSITSQSEIIQKDNKDIDLENIYIHKSGGKFTSYSERQNYPKAVADIRQGKDEGMIDIFNIDRAYPEELKKRRSAFENETLLDIIQQSGYEAVKPTNLNVYINKDILQTRGFHIDSLGPNLKAFIYLSDVETMDKGPYCYVRKSHRDDNPARELNRALSHAANRTATDAPFVDPELVTPILARKGDLVVSDQSGIHRGFPQSPGSERYMAVMRYK